jgi:hypothetical protein
VAPGPIVEVDHPIDNNPFRFFSRDENDAGDSGSCASAEKKDSAVTAPHLALRVAESPLIAQLSASTNKKPSNG